MLYFLTAVVAFLLGIEYNEWRWQTAARKSAAKWWEDYKKANPNWEEELKNGNLEE